VISKFTMLPRRDAESGRFAPVSRHWNIDRPDPRSRRPPQTLSEFPAQSGIFASALEPPALVLSRLVDNN